jgi:precorrin-6B methylase 2
MSSKAQRGAAKIRQFHGENAGVADRALQAALQIAPFDEDNIGTLPALLHRYGNQNFGFEQTSFRDIREIFRAIAPKPAELFCDAGAGYGHVVLYGALVAPCRWRAIEILPTRCEAMQRSAHRLGLGTIDIVQGDALAQDYSDVTYLLLNSPFFAEVAAPFIERLAAARNEAMTVLAMNTIVTSFRESRAFREIDVAVDIANYRFGMFRLKD